MEYVAVCLGLLAALDFGVVSLKSFKLSNKDAAFVSNAQGMGVIVSVLVVYALLQIGLSDTQMLLKNEDNSSKDIDLITFVCFTIIKNS